MSGTKRTVLITGCSDGGLGSGLAIAFHNAGLKVYATSRNTAKMKGLEAMGIETLELDVLDNTSIEKCRSQISQLDILVNNAGMGGQMPISDLDVADAKKVFDLNVWSYLTVTQAFLPLLIESKGTIVNQTSLASITAVPFGSVYAASKAAIAMFSDCLRQELKPFGISVHDLKTGGVESNIWEKNHYELPKGSLYEVAREAVEHAMSLENIHDEAVPQAPWAAAVVADLLKKKPKYTIWHGSSVWLAWFGTLLPHGLLDGTIQKLVGLDVVEKKLKEAGK
ncbi:NAD(P)-binding protein [Microthyrium microscopicum]|uniref:NAD(P)-binding protein n=1 Tax=Microthyrium microscopicum TaxID=703497 RepID=A0A6A6TZW8_9PEZI|nr:NAD(P)-binding protein [Microthyrium microscopicum]